MTYYEDLSDYSYMDSYARPGTKNIGWLQEGQDFGTHPADENLLKALWDFCKIAVADTRGFHSCDFCGNTSVCAQRDGKFLFLGTSEIRAFSKSGLIYSAPSMIYHYIELHGYKPPPEFIDAVLHGLQPSSSEYFQRLEGLGLDWRVLPERDHEPETRIFRFD